MSKRYYWLRLKDNFFASKEIKKLRKIAGGDTYTIIYLKMQLLSIKKSGIICFDDTEENIIEQLSLELDEDENSIKMTLLFLEKNQLIEKIPNDNYLLTRVPELIGSESTSAERMRRKREKDRLEKEIECHNVTEALHTSDERHNVTEALHTSDEHVQKCYTEIEKEIEIKKEKESINQSIKENLSKQVIEAAQKKEKDDRLIDSKNHSFLEKLKNRTGASNEQIKKAIERLDNQENIRNFNSYLTKTVQSIQEEDKIRQMVNRSKSDQVIDQFGQKTKPDKHKKIFNALLMS